MLYYAILASVSKGKAVLLISILVYLSFAFRIDYNNGLIGGRETIFYVLNLGVLRAVGEMGWGILLAEIYERIHQIKQICPPRMNTRIIACVLRIIEVFALIQMFKYFLLSRRVNNHIILIIVFSALLMVMLSSYSMIGKLLNSKCMGLLGKYAYAIYVMQQSSFIIMRKTIWLNEDLVSMPWLALSVSVLFSILLGIAAYYVIEAPCTRIYMDWYKRYLVKKRSLRKRICSVSDVLSGFCCKALECV